MVIGNTEQLMNQVMSIVLSLLLFGLVAVQAGAQSATPMATAGQADLQAAAEWLISQQGEDGGFLGFSGESEVSITIDAIIALVAAEHRGVDTGTAIDEAVAFMESGDGALVYAQTGAGQAAKLVLGILAFGGDPHDFAGVDPLALLEQGPDADTGLYGTGVYDHALTMLALAATDTDIPAEAFTAIEGTQTPEGGWAFDGSVTEGAADSNTTSLIVQALVAAGEGDSPLVADGLAYLQTALVDQSGATFQPGAGTPADANSTALVMQAVIAAGEDPSSEAWGNLPAALSAFQNESGAFFYNADDTSDNIFATVQAIPAVAGLAQPILPSSDVADPSATPLTLRFGAGFAQAA